MRLIREKNYTEERSLLHNRKVTGTILTGELHIVYSSVIILLFKLFLKELKLGFSWEGTEWGEDLNLSVHPIFPLKAVFAKLLQLFWEKFIGNSKFSCARNFDGIINHGFPAGRNTKHEYHKLCIGVTFESTASLKNRLPG